MPVNCERACRITACATATCSYDASGHSDQRGAASRPSAIPSAPRPGSCPEGASPGGGKARGVSCPSGTGTGTACTHCEV
jgi:hypothetical protein